MNCILILLFAYSLINIHQTSFIIDSQLNLTEVAYHNEPSAIYLGSPSIVRLSSGRILASHDFFGSGFRSNVKNVSVFFSDDDGNTWQFLSYIKNSYWTTMAVYKDNVYAIGTDSDTNGRIIIHRSTDNGKSWSYQGTDDGVILFDGGFATGATPIVIADNVMYRSIEYFPKPYRWPTDFQAAIISCDLNTATEHRLLEDEDPIMSPKYWRITPPLPFDRSWIEKAYPSVVSPGYLEGNVVVIEETSPKVGLRVLNIIRFNSIPYANLVIILELNRTNNSLFFVDVIDFPGGMSKFSIRYDPISAFYFSFVNPVTFPYYPEQRNILSLSYSKDLIHWDVMVDRLLFDDTGFSTNDSLRYTGFHYVDWQFDFGSNFSNQSSCIQWNCQGGPDIIYLIRTSYRGANSYHNSNRITYKQLKNFRQYL